MSGNNFSFGPEFRLRKKSGFSHVQEHGRKLYSKHFVILVSGTDLPQSRLGVTITRKIDSRAVVRNRIRRRVREVFRLNRHLLERCCDIVVIARSHAQECSFADIRREILGALYHGNFMKHRVETQNS